MSEKGAADNSSLRTYLENQLKSLNKPERTFCDFPFATDIHQVSSDVAIIGAPHGTPYRPGTPSHAANAAHAVRNALAWYSTNPEQYDFDSRTNVFGGATVVDCGDVPGDLDDGVGNRSRIEAAVSGILESGAVPMLLGGDDSVPIPFFSAYEGHHEFTVLQIDAHLDWRHEVHGVTHGFSSTMRRASEMPQVIGMVQAGVRGPGSARKAELADAEAWGSLIFPANEVETHGIEQVVAAIPEGSNVVFSIDVDGLDPALVPGILLPAPGGIGYQQMITLIRGVASRATIVGAAFVEFMPEKDINGYGARVIARLASVIIATIGHQRIDTTRPATW